MMAKRLPPRRILGVAAVSAWVLFLSRSPAVIAEDAAAGREFFEKRIRPVLVRHCYECHSAATKAPKGGLRLDTRAGLRQGGDSGPVIILGKPEESLLVQALRHEGPKMPPRKKLPDAVAADFARWVEMGAPDPRGDLADAKTAAALVWEAQFEERRQWWSLQPVVEAPPPPVRDSNWSRQPVDRFLLAKLEAQGLRPAPRADRAALVRRLSFALLGLPPTPTEVERFVADRAPDAWVQLVDRLLASPHFGEQWARHWMDVVRYTDTYGYEWDIPAKGAWRYRDYLIRAFNQDLPFDQLVREHIAGDLLETPRLNPAEQINESLAGVMFYQMGEKRHGDSAEFNGIHQEMLDNKIDALGKAFLATTISCARCHDHKLDAVSQRDYYALAGVFMSSRWVTNTLDIPERNAAVVGRLRAVKAKLRPALAALWIDEVNRFPEAVAAGPAAKSTGWRALLDPAKTTKPAIEDNWYPWSRLSREATSGSVAERWRALAQQYGERRKVRAAQNARDFVEVADFRRGAPEGWSVDGVGLREVVPCGDFTVALTGPAAVSRLLPGGLYTHALSPRFNGAVRTPYLSRFDKRFLSFETCGGDFSTHRTVIDNAFLTEKQKYLQQPALGWLRLSTEPTMKDRYVYLELATKTSNPNFPPRVGLGGACSEEQADDPRSWFGVRRVVAHDRAAAPADELTRFERLFTGEPPGDLGEAARRYAAWFRAALEAWAADRATEDDVTLINWLLDRGVLTNQQAVSGHPEIAKLVGEYRDLERRLALPETVNGMADLDPGYDYRLNVRGDYDQLADAVPRGSPRVLPSPGHAVPTSRSGRRELAEVIASPHNPLTARVFVNRVWHWLFGTGLVATPDDFGHLGERPSHAELLDYLASRFMAEGWSPKWLIRTLVRTEAWRQASEATPEALAADPDNRLLHHYPLRRLEAEALRDAMLAASGRLDRRLFGPPVNPHRQKEDPEKRLFSGPLDGDGHRSLYVKITIMEPPRFLATFNQPTPKIPTGKRDLTNTPAQALALLNDPFVADQAERWADRLVAVPHATVAERLRFMFSTALGRKPTHDEVARWTAAVADFAALREVQPTEVLASVGVWRDVAHAIFNTKEFIYVR
jgi:hypothetical protein